MRRNACPSPLRQARQFSRGADQEMKEHLDSCAECAAAWNSWNRVVELGKNLEDGCPAPDRIDALRSALLVEATSKNHEEVKPRRSMRLIAGIAASVTIISATYFAAKWYSATAVPPIQSEILRGRVHAQRGAEHTVVGAQPDEMVRLAEGTITVEVEPLLKGERFRVITGDAEVEVRGTIFDVTANGDRLVAVHVLSGRVEVRPSFSVATVLGPGEYWMRPEPEQKPDRDLAEIECKEPSQTSRAPRNASNARDMKEEGTDEVLEPALVVGPAEAAFNEGWSALRSGAYREAAQAFERALQTGESSKILEDASYWKAMALTRAGSEKQAIAALQEFLASYPRSPRVGEAEVVLGWKLLRAQERDAALLHFRAAASDPVPKVRESAR
jgi:tetratricopeptide (TPR) repeat protein